jgi:(1->4)-alpha-D-glucan 1-alpha-D-glucosylmutase
MTIFRVPAATYMLQFNRAFKFSAAEALVPYLHELGISEIYASPLFQAVRGSLHGYSVTNPMELNQELGSQKAFDALTRRLKNHGMDLMFDIVPNHMALSPDNPWWMEVLENGPISPYSIFFDIDWHPPNRILEGKLLLPILGRPYGQALEDQELRLSLEPGGFVINYYTHKFPLDPKTYRDILSPGLERLAQDLGEASPAIIALMGIISLISNLPPRHLISPQKAKDRQQIYARVVEAAPSLKKLIYDKKKLIMASLFGGEVENQVYYTCCQKFFPPPPHPSPLPPLGPRWGEECIKGKNFWQT